MMFPWILLIVLNGQILPWAGFQTVDACEQVRSHLNAPKGATMTCTRGAET